MSIDEPRDSPLTDAAYQEGARIAHELSHLPAEGPLAGPVTAYLCGLEAGLVLALDTPTGAQAMLAAIDHVILLDQPSATVDERQRTLRHYRTVLRRSMT